MGKMVSWISCGRAGRCSARARRGARCWSGGYFDVCIDMHSVDFPSLRPLRRSGSPPRRGHHFGGPEGRAVLEISRDHIARYRPFWAGMFRMRFRKCQSAYPQCERPARLRTFRGTYHALARAYADLGRFDDAIRCIDQALILVEETKEMMFEADIIRIAGELALKSAASDL